jgi:DNA-binding MarR family transcriptional regulator
MARMRTRAAVDRGPEPTDTLQFMRALWAVAHGLQKASKRMRGQLGVTGPQRLVLRVVGIYPGISAGALASVLHVHPSTLTGILQRLVAQGLLRRYPHVTDRRRSELYLSRSGERLNALQRGTIEAAVSRALQSISDREAVAARRALVALAEHLDPQQALAAAGSRQRRRPPAQDWLVRP